MPTETIENRARKNRPRPFQVGLRITWPDELTEDNDFLLEFVNRDSNVQNPAWQAIGSYPSKKQAQEEADDFVGSDINVSDWQEI